MAAPRGGRLQAGDRPGAEARLRIALPVKGRLRESSVDLLEHSGFAPDAPDERALAFTCSGAPLEVLLVRAADIPEYVQDGAVDCGITGADLARERGADVRELLRLGYGHCTLEPAVLTESELRNVEELDGLRVATSYPRLTRELLEERGVSVELVDVTGSVEVAPRLGLADAIVDLVSSGNTLRTNGLRSLGPLFSSEAVLIGPQEPGRGASQLASVFRSVVQARASRYLMMNAPESALERICELVPGSGSPSVIPLSEPGMVAVHVLVPAREVWRLLPRLEAAGASSILLVPVERLVP